MASTAKVRMDLKKLQDLYESLKHRPSLWVGVAESKDARKEVGMTNNRLAMIHEYGAPEHGIPARSFVRTPIADHAVEIMAPIKEHIQLILKTEGAKKLWEMVGHACEQVISHGFDTGGYGKWAPLKYSTLMAKLNIGKFRNLHRRKLTIAHIYAGNIGMGILVDHAELRNSVSSQVDMKF